MDVMENICRLCFNIIGSQYLIIDNTIKETFDILLIKLNLDIYREHIICNDCAKTILRCLHFKSVCVDKEQQILSTTINNAESKYMSSHELENNKDVEDVSDINTCTFCMNKVKSNDTNMGSLTQTAFLDMLPIFLPEKNLFRTKKNHTCCSSCRKELEVYFNFICFCVHIEEMIERYIQQNKKMAQINLMDVRDWLLQNGLEIHDSCLQTSHFNRNLRTVTCDEEKETFKAATVKHKVLNEVRTHKCNICTYESRWRFNLERHMIAHNDVQTETYKCPFCTYKTKNKYDVNRHAVKHKEVTEENLYKCQHCAYQTARKGNFRTHQLIHKSASEVRTYKCLVCPFESKYTNGLKSHQLTHATTVEMYKCTYGGCTFETKRKECLRIHNLRHKDASETVYYKCTACKYQTNRKGSLTQHSVVHKRALEATRKCSYCSFVTKNKTDLKGHLRTHRDILQPKFKCDSCEYVTPYKRYLKTHVRMHQKQTK